jgi:hypothetical protein
MDADTAAAHAAMSRARSGSFALSGISKLHGNELAVSVLNVAPPFSILFLAVYSAQFFAPVPGLLLHSLMITTPQTSSAVVIMLRQCGDGFSNCANKYHISVVIFERVLRV